MSFNPIYHICRRTDWEAAAVDGVYRGGEGDTKDGFLHFSMSDQVEESAALHRAGEEGLVLLMVDPRDLGDALKWEPGRGDLFPHLYGALPTRAVMEVFDLPLGPDGKHKFPKNLR